MTEYDYSPDAWERFIETQHRIARWVDGTRVQPPCNAFAPATPHIQFLELAEQEKKERRHKSDLKYSHTPDSEYKADKRKGPPKSSPKKDRRRSYDDYGRDRDRKYRSDTEEEDYASNSNSRATRRYRDSHTTGSHVSASNSRHHERSSSRQESHISSRDKRVEKYLPTASTRERHRSSSSREKDRSDSEYRSSSRTSYTTPATSRSQSRQGAAITTGQGYVLVEKEPSRPRTSHNTPAPTRASTPTKASSRPRATSHATPASAAITSPTKSMRSSSTAVPTITTTATPTKSRPRASSRSQVSPTLTLDLPPFGQPHVVNDYAGYPAGPRHSAATTSNGVYPYPQQHGGPNSAPPMTRLSPTPTNFVPAYVAPQPKRSQTTPMPSSNRSGLESRNSYDSAYSWQTGPLVGAQTSGSGHTSSPTKGSTSLLKRMFTGLTIGKAGGASPKKPSKDSGASNVSTSTRESSGRRVLRKRSTSF